MWVGGYGKSNINNILKIMSLEVNFEHSVLYPTEYKPLCKLCYTEIKDHMALK